MLYQRLRSYMSFTRFTRIVTVGAVLALCAAAPTPARADSDLGMQVLNFLGIGVGGYWFTSDSAVDALGTPKFVGHTTFYVKWKHMGGYRITGGFQEISIKDHWQPFSGGNKVTLQGAAFKLTTVKKNRFDLVPFVNGGVFYGKVDSYKKGFSSDSIVPSVAVGLEKELVRYVRLSAGYRLTGKIGGVDTSGGYVSLTLFP